MKTYIEEIKITTKINPEELSIANVEAEPTFKIQSKLMKAINQRTDEILINARPKGTAVSGIQSNSGLTVDQKIKDRKL